MPDATRGEGKFDEERPSNLKVKWPLFMSRTAMLPTLSRITALKARKYSLPEARIIRNDVNVAIMYNGTDGNFRFP